MKYASTYCTLLFVVIFLSSCTPQNKPINTTTSTVTTQETTPTTGTSSSTSITLFDSDKDGISDSLENQLIESFSPVVRLHPEEKYQPADISWYLSRVRMRFDVEHGFDDSILEKGNVNVVRLTVQSNRGFSSGLSATTTDYFLETTDNNGGDSDDDYKKETQTGNDISNSICYVHVRYAPEGYSGMYDVQFIFFYAYNGDLVTGPLNTAHEADFEHITVRVESDLKTINQIYYSGHENEGRWYKMQTAAEFNDGFRLTESGRPVIYSGLNSHASYPWAGKWPRNNLPDDQTSDGGRVWDCKVKVVNLGEKSYPNNDMQWIQYSGHWGEIGTQSWTTGPCGPAYQNWWNSDLQ
jgi:hypothetical protein